MSLSTPLPPVHNGSLSCPFPLRGSAFTWNQFVAPEIHNSRRHCSIQRRGQYFDKKFVNFPRWCSNMLKVRWVMSYGFVANFIRFPAMEWVWKSFKIWQSYREFKGGNFFETQCRHYHSIIRYSDVCCSASVAVRRHKQIELRQHQCESLRDYSSTSHVLLLPCCVGALLLCENHRLLIRPCDITVGGLRFYRDFFLLFFFSSAIVRACQTELN